MAKPDYIYAVARIRAKELLCFGSPAMEQLMACKTYEECLRMLNEKGWGDGSAGQTPESLLDGERNKTWEQLRELVEDMSVFDVFLYANDYHNLKAAIKENYAPSHGADIYSSNGTIDPAVFRQAADEHDFSVLPAGMRDAAEEAMSVLRETGDGQLCDIIIDKAALNAILQAGKASGDPLLAFYAEHTVATANIKTAVRCQKTGKSLDFIQRALAECDTLDVSLLAQTAVESFEAIIEYLGRTCYSGAAEALTQSASAFERWCDNRLIEKIRPQKYETSTIGPLAAWLLARENEIKTVRILLSGKRNGLSDDAIRERLREMYV
ncbi:MAG: V-type ATPase subunit [Oscillospiraceae bacterium]|nr:V-type ATPase subunit [Oscillospiraceae bacterium]MDD7040941.1 V-type ATPase subunit [Oscillospiraceae bacterium]MDY2611830.1 V-type ATPase subunit [Oscillospiraceae bacterium]